MTGVSSIHAMLILLLFCGIVFSQYTSQPQWTAVENANQNLNLDGKYNDTFANSSVIEAPSPSHAILKIRSSVYPIGFSSMLDGSVCPSDGLSLLVARGVILDNFSDFYIGQCVEKASQPTVDYSGVRVDLSFRGANASYLLDTSVPIPENIRSAMIDSSGADNLSVYIHGDVKVTYQFDAQSSSLSGCTDNYIPKTGSIPISQNFTYRVYGANHLFFLLAPVLNEQWFRNNQFDIVVLSQVPLSSASVQLDGIPSGNDTLIWFENSSGPYGMRQLRSLNQSMLSNLTDLDSQSNLTQSIQWSETISNSSFIPSPIESQNHPFVFVYEFNTTYSDLGANNLSLKVNDACGGSGSYNESLLSRMLSFNGNMLENGSPIDTNISRGSVPFNEDTLNRTEISFGLVAVILLLAFINFWALK